MFVNGNFAFLTWRNADDF